MWRQFGNYPQYPVPQITPEQWHYPPGAHPPPMWRTDVLFGPSSSSLQPSPQTQIQRQPTPRPVRPVCEETFCSEICELRIKRLEKENERLMKRVDDILTMIAENELERVPPSEPSVSVTDNESKIATNEVASTSSRKRAISRAKVKSMLSSKPSTTKLTSEESSSDEEPSAPKYSRADIESRRRRRLIKFLETEVKNKREREIQPFLEAKEREAKMLNQKPSTPSVSEAQKD